MRRAFVVHLQQTRSAYIEYNRFVQNKRVFKPCWSLSTWTSHSFYHQPKLIHRHDFLGKEFFGTTTTGQDIKNSSDVLTSSSEKASDEIPPQKQTKQNQKQGSSLQLKENRKVHNRPTYAAIEITSDGNVRAVRLTIPEILRKSNLHVRDLFSLSLTQVEEETQHGEDKRNEHNKTTQQQIEGGKMYKMHLDAILPRENEIVLSFGYIKAMISPESVTLFDAQNPNVQKLAMQLSPILEQKHKEARNIFMFEPKKYVRYLGDPFELVFLEEVLRDTCCVYRRRIHVYKPIVDALLSRVHNEVFSDQGINRLLPIKDSLQDFEIMVKSSLSCLKQILDQNEDLMALLITDKIAARENKLGTDIRHNQNVELLFEEYVRQLNTLLQEINFLLKRVQSKQELIAISLSAYRNRMITMNVYLSITGISLASGTAMTSWFGMNLLSGIEQSPTAFTHVVMSTCLISVGIFIGCVFYISSSNMKKRAMHRHEEIQTLTGALSNMEAIDYAVRCMADQNRSFSKDSFRDKLMEFRQRPIEERELDMLFGAVEVGKSGILKYTG